MARTLQEVRLCRLDFLSRSMSSWMNSWSLHSLSSQQLRGTLSATGHTKYTRCRELYSKMTHCPSPDLDLIGVQPKSSLVLHFTNALLSTFYSVILFVLMINRAFQVFFRRPYQSHLHLGLRRQSRQRHIAFHPSSILWTQQDMRLLHPGHVF